MLQRFRMCLACATLVAISAQSQGQELPAPCINCAGGFVSSGAASYTTSGHLGTIDQLSERAILNWRSFNIGANDSVVFNQPSTSSAALNRIFQQDPVRILGSLTANGQVYLINPNGIIFGRGAQVNARGLVASTLGISDDVFLNRGLTGAINTGDSVEAALPAFSGDSAAPVLISQGAHIKVGERVMLIGAEVRNEGTIEAPNGQAILAGSHDTVYLAADPELRGLLIEVGTGGDVTNLGSIITERGNTTLVGLAVNQLGRISASTSVNVNGSIRLLARDGARVEIQNNERRPVATRGGELVIGSDSVTEVGLTDLTETAVDGQPQQRSFIEGMGRTIHVQSDALVLVPGGDVELTATSTPNQPLIGGDPGAKVFLDEGSLIDVSGDTSTIIAMERNQGTIRLFGNELADAPVQRDGPLARQPITVDLRRGTPLTDISPLLDQVRRTVGERMSVGGTVTLRAEGDVVVDTGATIDISGGQVEYLPGFLSTTQLVSNGRTIDISDADPLLQYDGIVNTYTRTDSKWGVTESWIVRGGTFEPGYVEGKDAGRLVLETRTGAIALAGEIRADTVRGLWQRESASSLAAGLARPYTEVPLGGSLEIVGLSGDVRFDTTTAPQVFAFDTILPRGLATSISSQLFEQSGINRVDVKTAGRVEIPADVRIELDAGGSFSVSGSDVRVAGDIRAQSGSVELVATATTTEAGRMEIAATADIDVAGGWVNETPLANDGLPTRETLFIDGGRIELASQGDLTLAAGSRLNVSAGAALLQNDELRYGDAGSISLASALPSAIASNFAAPTLTLEGELLGFGFTRGGRLELSAAGFHISDRPFTPGVDDAALAPPLGHLSLAPEFFRQGGFADFELRADRGDVFVESGTHVLLRPQNLQLQEGMFRARTGAAIETFSERVDLFDHERGTSSFTASVERAQGIEASDAEIRIGADARIETELGGSIGLSADTNVRIEGALVARGGSIDVEVKYPDVSANDTGYVADQAIRLGSGAALDVSGAARVFADAQGIRTGDVLDGGTISLRAVRGYVIGASDSHLDVSGTSERLHLPGADGGFEPTTIASAAGSVEVQVAEGGSLAGSIDAHGGGDTAADGTLRVNIDASLRDFNRTQMNPGSTPFPAGRREIVVGNGTTVVGSEDTPPASQNGRFFVSAEAVQEAGFDTIELAARPFAPTEAQQSSALPSAVRFEGDIDLRLDRSLTLDVGILESDGGVVALTAPHVALGQTETNFRSQAASVSTGSGVLSVEAQHIDLNGSLVFRGFGGDDRSRIVLDSSGDIRLNGVRLNGDPTHLTGSLISGADLTLRADRIYPSTLTHYAINVLGTAGRIGIEGAGTSTTPLSAAGQLTLSAATIEQGGVLLAPFGSIELNASESLILLPGSVTSVSAAGTTVPFGITEFGQTWIYPFDERNLVVDGAPDKRIELQAPDIDIQSGSVIDLSGGGDLLTFEFVKGPGGSRDILLGDNPDGAFAIIPASALGFGVSDPLESARAGIEIGSTIELAGGGGIPAGEYVRLPARYALLPGAYLVTPVEGTNDISPVTPQLLADDRTPVVAGRLGFAGNDTSAARWSGFAIESAAQVRQRAEFNVLLASTRFEEGESRPADAGSLVIDADRAIRIGGTLAAAAASGGRGASVDVIANDLAVVNARTTSTERVELVDSELANFAAASLMLGGARSREEDRVTLDVQANSVQIDSGTTLAAAEVVLAARDEVSIAGGATLAAEGAHDTAGPEEFAVTGDGAFVRLSTADQAAIERTGASGQAGAVTIAEGATLSAARSINVEASRDVRSAGDLVAPGGSLSLTASLIALGDTDATTGLALTRADLGRFQARELQLNSRSTIDIHGDVSAELDTVRLNAAGLRGIDSDGRTASLAANTLVLENARGSSVAHSGSGTGQLVLSATQLEIGAGTVDVSGFASVEMRASEQLIATESGALHAHGDLTIATPRITAEHGVDLDLSADGVLTTRAMDTPSGVTETTALGAKVRMAGASIDHGGRIELASGLVTFEASGADGVTLRAGSAIDVSGRDVTFDDLVVGSAGGEVALSAASGSVRVEDTALIDVSAAAAGGDAGRLTVDAREGALAVGSAAILQARADEDAKQGTFSADVGSLEGSFSSLNAQLNGGGFTQRRDLTVAAGELVIGADDTVIARQVNLAADSGSIVVDGSIAASGASGGEVRLSALNEVRVSSSGRITANAMTNGEEGGRVELATVAGTIAIEAAPGAIDVSGRSDAGAFAATGVVHLRTPRIGTTGVAVSALPTDSIVGAERIDIEAVRVYDAATIDATLMTTIAADTDAYMAGAAAIEAGLGIGDDARYRLIAGEEVRSAGDLTLLGTIDLASRRYDAAAGVLTLRAGGHLVVNGTLTDGLAQEQIVPGYPRDIVQTGDSWSYRLVGGARLDGADVLGQVKGAGDVVIGDGATVRTGTGSIDVSAGRDLVFSSGVGSIYTVGENRGTGALAPADAEITLLGDFVENGGDVRIDVARDVRGVTNTYFADYMPRSHGEFIFWRPGEIFPLAWAIDPSKFVHGVGALGGGNVSIEAERDVTSLTVAIPTNAQAGAFDGSDLRIAGGGDLGVRAGGAINGGNYLLGRGSGVLSAGESIGSDAAGIAPTLQIGDARMALQARKDVEIGTAFNPTVGEQNPEQGLWLDFFFFRLPTYAFSYTDASTIGARSIAGDVTLSTRNAETIAATRATPLGLLTLYPGNLSVQSLRGSILLDGQIDLFPARNGTLALLAGDSVQGIAPNSGLLQSDADPSLFPSLIAPTTTIDLDGLNRVRLLDSHAAVPIHRDDTMRARIVAQTGDIGSEATIRFVLSEQANIYAGQDIVNPWLLVQQNDSNDVTVIRAGRDITYPEVRGAAGQLVDSANLSIDVAGPGRVDLIAGRDVTLGTSGGLVTRGNLSNPALPEAGADISIFTGLTGSLPVEAFIAKYLGAGSSYADELAAFVARFETSDGGSDLDKFRGLDESVQRAFIVAVFFNELRESGVAAAEDGDFGRGYAAIETLFPEEKYAGELSSFLSRIATLDGGAINLLVPGGLVNAGVASSGRFTRSADRLGIVAQRDGDVNGFVKGDFLVNASRVFALDGGDVLLWSSEADIDAGRGAKSALAIPPPAVRFDAQGNTIVEFPPAVAGSGIRTAVSTPGKKPGDVYLFAPAGVVDAGDAGIESAGNITVVATQVIGADNITAAGTSVGVPVDTGGLGASLAGVSAASSSATNSATSADDSQNRSAEDAPLAETALSWLEVFVVGLGEDNCKQDDIDCLKRQTTD